MAWRLAKGLEQLRKQVNEKYPTRSKASDGSVGDTSHSARKSDHNPDSRGIVHAIDITHDPRNGFDSYKFAEALRQSRDPRILNVISNGRIFASNVSPWEWRKYTGANKHDHHVHVSIVTSREDDVSPWNIGDKPVVPKPDAPPTAHEVFIKEVKAFQTANGLHPDGEIGPQTWAKIKGKMNES